MNREEYKGKVYELRNAPEGCDACCFDEEICGEMDVPDCSATGESWDIISDNYWCVVEGVEI